MPSQRATALTNASSASQNSPAAIRSPFDIVVNVQASSRTPEPSLPQLVPSQCMTPPVRVLAELTVISPVGPTSMSVTQLRGPVPNGCQLVPSNHARSSVCEPCSRKLPPTTTSPVGSESIA